MFDIVFGWISANYPFLFVILFVAVITWIVCKRYYKHMDKFEEISNKVNNLPCSSHEETYRRQEEKLNHIAERIENLPCKANADAYRDIREMMITITTYLATKDTTAKGLFSQKASPRQLNEEGKKLFDDCNGEHFLQNNEAELIEAIASRNPLTALDVENIANEVLITRLDSPIFNELKQWVYNSPNRELNVNGERKQYAVTMTDVCFVLSLPLRDKYLERHPELEGLKKFSQS